MAAGIAVAVLVLFASAAVLSRLARRLVRERWPFVLRQGVANLYRPANQTRAVVLSLGFATFLLCTLFLVQASLLRAAARWRATRRRRTSPSSTCSRMRCRGSTRSCARRAAPVLQAVAIVPMRIAAIERRGRGGDREEAAELGAAARVPVELPRHARRVGEGDRREVGGARRGGAARGSRWSAISRGSCRWRSATRSPGMCRGCGWRRW